MIPSTKKATTASEINPLLSERWSPYGFARQPVSTEDLHALFEAARWTQSSYNEQPWRYIVATRSQPQHFDALLACLVEGNQAWAKFAPVLALGVVSNILQQSGKANPAAEHDLGAASAALTLEATARGLCVHQMIGIEPEKAREVFAIPANYHALTGLAIGYPGTPPELPPQLVVRDQTPRERRDSSEFVFSGQFGQGADWLS